MARSQKAQRKSRTTRAAAAPKPSSPSSSPQGARAASEAPGAPDVAGEPNAQDAATDAAQRPRKKIGRPKLTPEQKAERDRRAKERRKQKLAQRAAIRELAVQARKHAEDLEAELAREERLHGHKKHVSTFEPTVRDRQQVEILAGVGSPLEEIAALIENPDTGMPIDEQTLKKHFQREMQRGRAVMHSQLRQKLFKTAMGDGKAAVTAGIFLAKTRLGWSERMQVAVDVTTSGVLVAPERQTPEQWLANAAAGVAATAGESMSRNGGNESEANGKARGVATR